MFVFWEEDLELRNKVFPFCQAGKGKARSVSRAYLDVTVRTDPWRRPLAREELFPMTLDTRLMIRKLRNIRKGISLGANKFPIL